MCPVYVKQILQNPWELINFSSPAKIHMDSFLSVFNIAGLHDELYHNCRNYCAILPYESYCVKSIKLIRAILFVFAFSRIALSRN
jgi:hypothetical protein